MQDEATLLYRQLASPDPHLREQATAQLWQLYFGAAGSEAEIRLLQAEQAVESGLYDTAESWLNDLIADFPEFAEAWNRRATLYYLVKNYIASLADCCDLTSAARRSSRPALSVPPGPASRPDRRAVAVR